MSSGAITVQPEKGRPLDVPVEYRVYKGQLDPVDIPVGPILSMKEIAEEKSLRDTGTVVEVDHPVRGKYLTVGNPIKMTDSISEVKRSPLLGEHTDEILSKVLGMDKKTVAEIKASGALSAPEKKEKSKAA